VKRWRKACPAIASTIAVLVLTVVPAYAAGSSLSNPLQGQSADVGHIFNNALGWTIGAVTALAAAVCLIFLYFAVANFAAGSTNAQKREQAKVQFVYVLIAGVLAGAGGAVLAAMYNLGHGLAG
jgi:hypothetical protein